MPRTTLITSSIYRNISSSPAHPGNGDVSSAALLHHIGSCSVHIQSNYLGSISNLTAACTDDAVWYRAVPPGLRHSATDFSGSPQPSTDWRRPDRLSSDATLHVALSYERDLGGTSCVRFSLFRASDGENRRGNAKWLLRPGAVDRCCAASEGERCFGSPVYRPGSCPPAGHRGSLTQKMGRNAR